MPTRAELSEIEAKREAAKKIIDLLMEISTLLNTNLDRATMSVCVSMIENGVNPEALATVIRELRKEGADPDEDVGDSDEATMVQRPR